MIVWLVRRDHLHGRYAMWWLGVAVAFAVFGVFPQLADVLASGLGIAYPPILIVLAGIGALVIKMVTMDIERTKGQVRINRLAQRLAMLEAELAERNKGKNKKEAPGVEDRHESL